MCDLYTITRSQEEMRRLFAVSRDLTGNLPRPPDIFPDQTAPIVRLAGGERQLEMMLWGMPGPLQFGGAPVTNIRHEGPAPAPLARAQELLPGTRELVLRVGRHEAEEDVDLVSRLMTAGHSSPSPRSGQLGPASEARRRTRSRASTGSMAF